MNAAALTDVRRPLTPHVPVRRVTVLVNPRSGGVGAKATAEVMQLMAQFDCESEVVELDAPRLSVTIDEALAAKPDLIVVLAGDGTARTVASRAGPDGPLIAPLPGGTMNMLPRALYGTTDWKAALEACLTEGEIQCIAGGEIAGEAFYVAAILGSPALWAPAREAMRGGKVRLAWLYGRRALHRAFSSRTRFVIDGGRSQRGEALILLSPMISKAMDEPTGLEAAVLDVHDAREAFGLAARAMFSDWRQDPSVKTRPARRVTASAGSRIPAIIDGEPLQLPEEVEVRFLPRAFRALAPKPPAAEDAV